MPHSERIAEFLLSIGAVRLSLDPLFTWTSGIKSPIYCDNRMVLSHPEARTFIVQALSDRVRNLHIEPDVIAGTATAGIAWGALSADRLNLPFVYVRAEAKEHGKKKQIEGDLKPGQHVVLIEDLISTGGSSLNATRALHDEGQAVVTDIVSIFWYGFPSANEKAQEQGIHLHPLSTITVLLAVAKERGMLSSSDIGRISAFVQDPQQWSP